MFEVPDPEPLFRHGVDRDRAGGFLGAHVVVQLARQRIEVLAKRPPPAERASCRIERRIEREPVVLREGGACRFRKQVSVEGAYQIIFPQHPDFPRTGVRERIDVAGDLRELDALRQDAVERAPEPRDHVRLQGVVTAHAAIDVPNVVFAPDALVCGTAPSPAGRARLP
jgi:hypothetical protein